MLNSTSATNVLTPQKLCSQKQLCPLLKFQKNAVIRAYTISATHSNTRPDTLHPNIETTIPTASFKFSKKILQKEFCSIFLL